MQESQSGRNPRKFKEVIVPTWPFERDRYLREVGHASLTSTKRGAEMHSGIARQRRFQNYYSLNLGQVPFALPSLGADFLSIQACYRVKPVVFYQNRVDSIEPKTLSSDFPVSERESQVYGIVGGFGPYSTLCVYTPDSSFGPGPSCSIPRHRPRFKVYSSHVPRQHPDLAPTLAQS
eukprot:6179011-Pleurochrysis_carterae.AAC.2